MLKKSCNYEEDARIKKTMNRIKLQKKDETRNFKPLDQISSRNE